MIWDPILSFPSGLRRWVDKEAESTPYWSLAFWVGAGKTFFHGLDITSQAVSISSEPAALEDKGLRSDDSLESKTDAVATSALEVEPGSNDFFDNTKLYFCRRSSMKAGKWTGPLYLGRVMKEEEARRITDYLDLKASSGQIPADDEYIGDLVGKKNWGNHYGMRQYFNESGNVGRFGADRYFVSMKVEVNTGGTSGYYHCESGRCDFRFSAFGFGIKFRQGRDHRSFYVENDFDRLGVKVGITGLQVQGCLRTNTPPCYKDKCVEEMKGAESLAECGAGLWRPKANAAHGCFFGLMPKGLGKSYRVLEVTRPVSLKGGLEAAVTNAEEIFAAHHHA